MSSIFMLPVFPNFKKLELSDRYDIEFYTSQFDPFSDFNFTSMISYDTEHDFLISSLNNNLIVRFRDYNTNDQFYSFLGNSKIPETIELLLNLSEKEKLAESLFLIPEVVYSNPTFDHEKHIYKDDTNNFDYILSLKIMAYPNSPDLSHRRWRIRNFAKQHPHILSRHTIIAKDLCNRYIELFTRWGDLKAKKTSEIIIEEKALKNLLSVTHSLKLIFHQLESVEGELIGFSITEAINHEYIIGHFIKTNPIYKGASETLFHTVGCDMLLQGFSYLNSEQHLGNSGLRYTKESWKPVKYLKKAIVKRKSDINQ